ncbi:MAG: hypothetical protein RQ741_13470 [Wenzhouxiangellaceae bacterium]|nr:hypothetical protein [Wenzhouxiangellaceae bacterium]
MSFRVDAQFDGDWCAARCNDPFLSDWQQVTRSQAPDTPFSATAMPGPESKSDRRIVFARFMVAALENDVLIREAPAIVGRAVPD